MFLKGDKSNGGCKLIFFGGVTLTPLEFILSVVLRAAQLYIFLNDKNNVRYSTNLADIVKWCLSEQ